MWYSLDRFEGGLAVCEGEDASRLTLDRALLPAEAAEGDLLYERNGLWLIDREATAARRMLLRRKREALQKRSDGEHKG